MIYGDLKKGVGEFYYYTVVVCQNTFMFKHIIIIIIMVIICKTKHLNLKNNTTMVHREHQKGPFKMVYIKLCFIAVSF